MDNSSRFIFTIASLVLMAFAVGLVVIAGMKVVSAIFAAGMLDDALLDAIGFVVIAIAVFDVARYLIEEEVLRGREMRHAGEARRSLTKFMSAIVIAVFLEALVTTFKIAKDRPEQLLYPALLLFGGTAMIIGLGLYQYLSASVERQSPEDRRE